MSNKYFRSVSPTTTFYVRDPQGNVLAVYKYNSTLQWAEQHLYGSSRLGIITPGINYPGTQNYNYPNYNDDPVNNGVSGLREYELNNHLQNVMVTVSDKKIGVDENSDGIVDYYVADVVSANDYYPGGMTMPGRKYLASGSTPYRYSINGQEKTPEIAPNTTTAEFWQYDARIVRRWNVDPVVKPFASPYSAFSGNPIWKLDPKGDDDFFNQDGTFAYRTKTGSNIQIITKEGTKALSSIIPNSPANIKALVNVIQFYRPQTDIPKSVQVGISPNSSSKSPSPARLP